MRRLTLSELEAECQKLDHHRLGNWMARHVSRPLALRITQVVAPWGIGANAVTLCALLCALAGAAAFAAGNIWTWVIGAALLQIWYLLDHVDGQLARLRKTESLDGVALDYLMHHGVNFAVPLGIGHGLFVAAQEPGWLWVGALWSAALLARNLAHDVRYKAFAQRWKRVEGELVLTGGAGGRPEPATSPPRNWRLAPWLVAKACEMHVVMNLLALVALAELALADSRLLLASCVCSVLAVCALAATGRSFVKSLGEQGAEREFAVWFQPPPGQQIAYEGGWWRVRPDAQFPENSSAFRDDRSY